MRLDDGLADVIVEEDMFVVERAWRCVCVCGWVGVCLSVCLSVSGHAQTCKMLI
jgi:hypothetical protein